MLEEAVRAVLPRGVQIDYNGQSREFKQASGDIYFTFILALAFIYLVLAAQFESFIDPLIIMIKALRLSIFGAIVIAQWAFGTREHLQRRSGLITLVGLITKHGILLVEFANQQREAHGMRRRGAMHRPHARGCGRS